MTAMLVATANILWRLRRAPAAEALASVLDHSPDLVGLQEWGFSRRALLARHPSYAWITPAYGGNAVGFRRDRFDELGHRLRPVGLFCRADRGARPFPVLPPRVTTVVRLHDRATDSAVSVIDFHLVPGSQALGTYREDRPLLAARHQREVQQLGDLVADRLRVGDTVIAMGDSNFDGLELPGLTSAWQGRRDDPVGTLGSSRKIDDVFGPGPASAVTLVRNASDHAAVLVLRRGTR